MKKADRNGPSILSMPMETLRVHMYKCVYSLAGVIADLQHPLYVKEEQPYNAKLSIIPVTIENNITLVFACYEK